MLKRWMFGCLAVALCGGLALAQAPRPADKILEDIKAVKPPQERTQQAAQAYVDKKAGLILELYKAHPNNPELVTLLPERWNLLGMSGPGKADEVVKEIDEATAKIKNEKLAAEGGFIKMLSTVRANFQTDFDKAQAAVEGFIKAYPKDDRGIAILGQLSSMCQDEAKKVAIQDRILKDYPDSQVAKSLQPRSACARPSASRSRSSSPTRSPARPSR